MYRCLNITERAETGDGRYTEITISPLKRLYSIASITRTTRGKRKSFDLRRHSSAYKCFRVKKVRVRESILMALFSTYILHLTTIYTYYYRIFQIFSVCSRKEEKRRYTMRHICLQRFVIEKDDSD